MQLNRRLLFRVSFLLCLLVLWSCNSIKYLPDHPVSEIESSIAQHFTEDNLSALFCDYNNYSEYRHIIEDFFFSDEIINNISYQAWVKMSETPELYGTKSAELLDSIVCVKEELILSLISDFSIPELASYYNSHKQEQLFLRPVFCDAFVSIADSLQYEDIRMLYDSFKYTDIGDSLRPHYTQAREEIWPQIEIALEEYNLYEESLVEICLDSICNLLNVKLESSIDMMVDMLLDGKMPYEKSEQQSKYQKMLAGCFNEEMVMDVLNNNLRDLNSVICEGRNEFLRYIKPDLNGLTMTKMGIISSKVEYPKYLETRNMSAIYEIQNRKKDGKSILYGAASWFPGVVGWIATAADLIHTNDVEKAKAEEMEPYILNFVEGFIMHLQEMCYRYCEDGVLEFEKLRANGFESFSKYIYENY